MWLHLILILLATEATTGQQPVKGSSFFIVNGFYPHARLRQSGTGTFNTGSTEGPFNSDQAWRLELHPTIKDTYYIINQEYEYRLSSYYDARVKWKVVATNGHYNEMQNWKFIPMPKSKGYYVIQNPAAAGKIISKIGVGDNDITVNNGGAPLSKCLWKLVPTIKASIWTEPVFSMDNRQGTTDIIRKISVTTGVKRTSSKTISQQHSYKLSIEGSLSGLPLSPKIQAEFTSQLSRSFSESEEKFWSKTEEIDFRIPAGKNYMVMQHTVHFNGKLSYETCTLMTAVKVFESDGRDFKDPDHFIIGSTRLKNIIRD